MPDDGLRFPKIMPAWCYRDPQQIAEEREARRVSRETLTVQTAAPVCCRDRYYTQARRLHIQDLMRKLP